MDSKNLQRGARGDDVRALQMKLHRLGFDLAADGVFGPQTELAVRRLQDLFGHDPDGIVGEETRWLIETELRAGWNAQLPNAEELAFRAQRGAPHTSAGVPTTRSGARAQALIDELPSAPSLPDARHTAVPAVGVPHVAPGTSRPAGAPGREPSTTLPDRPWRR